MENFIKATDINNAICKMHNLEEFNCLAALFGWGYRDDLTYAVTVTEEKIKALKDFETEFFELYVEHCRMVYEYLWLLGYRDVVYIKA